MGESKYRPGGQIHSLDELLKEEFVYLNGKILHRGWVLSWQLRFALDMINAGRVYRVDRRADDV